MGDAYFAYIVIGGLALLVGALYLLGRYYPGSGADVIDWKPTRSVETELELELEDVDQMLEAQNERRRRRGEAELTRDRIETDVASDLREQRRRSQSYREDRDAQERDVEQLLAATNARRRRRRQPEITLEQLEAQLQADRTRSP